MGLTRVKYHDRGGGMRRTARVVMAAFGSGAPRPFAPPSLPDAFRLDYWSRQQRAGAIRDHFEVCFHRSYNQSSHEENFGRLTESELESALVETKISDQWFGMCHLARLLGTFKISTRPTCHTKTLRSSRHAIDQPLLHATRLVFAHSYIYTHFHTRLSTPHTTIRLRT